MGDGDVMVRDKQSVVLYSQCLVQFRTLPVVKDGSVDSSGLQY